MANDAFHDRLLEIVLSLPGAYEDRPWGSVHCKVDGKIFAGWGRLDSGEMSLGIRVDPDLQAMLVADDPRFTIARYVGKYGGVDMVLGPRPDWNEVEHFIVGSYRLIAPKKRIKELDARDAAERATTATTPARAAKKKRSATAPRAKPTPKAKAGARATAPRRKDA